MAACVAVVAVVAVADNGVIGADSTMPWRLPGDLARVRRLTMGKPLIMGRRTWESIGRPLPGRTSIVVTRNSAFTAEGAVVVRDCESALAEARRVAAASGAAEVVLFGGAAIYRDGLPHAERIHLTEVHAAPEGDTRLPPFDPADWRETGREDHPASAGAPAYSYVTLERRATA